MPHMRYEWCEVCSWSEVIFSKERLFSLSLFQYMLLENYIKLSRTFLFYWYIPKDYDHMYFSNRKSNTWITNFQRFYLYCPLTVMHKNVEEIIVNCFWFLAGHDMSQKPFCEFTCTVQESKAQKGWKQNCWLFITKKRGLPFFFFLVSCWPEFQPSLRGTTSKSTSRSYRSVSH